MRETFPRNSALPRVARPTVPAVRWFVALLAALLGLLGIVTLTSSPVAAQTEPDQPGSVELSGLPNVGALLTATLSVDGTVTDIPQWQWSRSPRPDATFVDIDHADSNSYTPTEADRGFILRVSVSYRDGNGTAKHATGTTALPVGVVSTSLMDNSGPVQLEVGVNSPLDWAWVQGFVTGDSPGGYVVTSINVPRGSGILGSEIWECEGGRSELIGSPLRSFLIVKVTGPANVTSDTLLLAKPGIVLDASTGYCLRLAFSRGNGDDTVFTRAHGKCADENVASGWKLLDYVSDYNIDRNDLLNNEFSSNWAECLVLQFTGFALLGPPGPPLDLTATLGDGSAGTGTGSGGGGGGGGGGGSGGGGGGSSGFDVGVAMFVVANGWSPADVGVAAVLAARSSGAVVVYTAGGVLSGETGVLLREALPAEVIIVGGIAAVSRDVRTQIVAASSGSDVSRVSGVDRVDTAAGTARRVLGDPAGAGRVTLIVANGWSPPDIGVAAALAARSGRSAVVYSEAGSLPDGTAELLRDYDVARVILVGGTAALSAGVQDAVSAAAGGASILRLTGADRVDTAGVSARRVLGNPAAAPDGVTLIVANGWSPPDVGVAAALAAVTDNAAVAYTAAGALPEATAALIRDYRASEVIIVGGRSAVSDAVREAIGSAAPGEVTVRRITGSTRTHTAANVARRILANF